MYPNPAKDYTSLNFSVNGEKAYIVIRDVSGKDVYAKQIDKSAGTEVIDVSSLALTYENIPTCFVSFVRLYWIFAVDL